MGFIKRISNAVKIEKSDSSASIFNFEKIAASRSAFKLDFIYDEELALKNPVKFIFKYANKTVFENAIETNPNIKKLLSENNLKQEFEIENVTSIITSHLIPTSRTAHRIYFNMTKEPVGDNYLTLIKAALIHDIGKAFIPPEILNKNGKLTSREREIVELHNRFSYEIIKTTDLSPQVARLAYEHHDYQKCLERSPLNQALTIADVYCALRENRPYKKAIDDIRAKAIMYDMATKGSFDVSYINYLWA